MFTDVNTLRAERDNGQEGKKLDHYTLESEQTLS